MSDLGHATVKLGAAEIFYREAGAKVCRRLCTPPETTIHCSYPLRSFRVRTRALSKCLDP